MDKNHQPAGKYQRFAEQLNGQVPRAVHWWSVERSEISALRGSKTEKSSSVVGLPTSESPIECRVERY
jgi:hypothetical protein